MIYRLIPCVALIFLAVGCTPKNNEEGGASTPAAVENPSHGLPLERLQLPDGFKIDVFASGVKNARSLCLTPGGTLFVSTRGRGSVYALRDTDGDYRADERYVIAEDLRMPNGVAFRNGSLYVATVSQILRYDDIEKRLANPPEPVVVTDAFPTERSHGWKYIAFGPDGMLYIPVGAPCNICESEEIFASITRIDVDNPPKNTEGIEVVQHGVRNTVGFDWHPVTGELWFTENGRDWMGDDSPACELNHAPRDGMHFGYPYCHQGDTPDPKFGDKRPCSDFTPPVQNLMAHVAPLGMEFYEGAQFPAAYKGRVILAEHGSWNRSSKSGYRVMMVSLDESGESVGYEPFIEGWLDNDKDTAWGRPVDLEHLPDGSLLISDDGADAVYRVYYEGG